MNSTCGFSKLTAAIASRERWPPLSADDATFKSSAATPQCSKWLRRVRNQASEPLPGNLCLMNCIGDIVRSIWSAWCWLTSAKRAPLFRKMRPAVGSSFPSNSFKSVVFPLPFSPTNTIRDSLVTVKLCGSEPTSVKSGLPEAGYLKVTLRGWMSIPLMLTPACNTRGRSASSSSAANSSASTAASSSSLLRRCFLEKLLVLPAAACPDLMYASNFSRSSVRALLWRARARCCSHRTRAHME
mmetsp:Transcript_10057/g.28385  ORF Transcript_10057/g.28385 Transcript_10057/m.28385 type:complete len:242 (+) Transcript_10057:423-1148(+)